MATQKQGQKTQERAQDWCDKVENPVARRFCKSLFAKIFIYEREEGLVSGLKRGLSERAGVAFYLTFLWSVLLMSFVLAKQNLSSVDFTFPHLAVEIYGGFLFWFVIANETDKWQAQKTEKRVFRKGLYIIILWFAVSTASMFIEAFTGRESPDELLWIWGVIVGGLILSGISTFFKHRECNSGKNNECPDSKD